MAKIDIKKWKAKLESSNKTHLELVISFQDKENEASCLQTELAIAKKQVADALHEVAQAKMAADEVEESK